MPLQKQCAYCREIFYKRVKISMNQWNQQSFCSNRCKAMKRTASDEDVVAMYESGLSSEEIARRLSLSGVHVCRIIKVHGKTRSPSDRIKMALNRPEVKEKMRAAVRGPCPEHVKEILRTYRGERNPHWKGGVTIGGGYQIYTSSKANGDRAGRTVHSVVMEEATGIRSSRGLHIHHIDGNKMNNSLGNLVFLRAEDHLRYHAIKSGLGKNNGR